MTDPAQQHRMTIERAAAARYKQSAGLTRDARRLVSELETEVDAYARRHDLNNVDHMLLWDSVRLVFLKVVGLDRATAAEAHATARVLLLEEHSI